MRTASWPRPEVLLVWLIGAHVVLKLLIFPLVMHAEPLGDESAYLNGGRALSNVLRDVFAFQSPDVAEVERNVVASGWFMPGMSILVAPLYLLVPDAPIWLVRGYLGVVTLALFIAVVRLVARRFGPAWACVLVVLPGLIPSWVVFTFGAWGDLCAGLVLVVLVVRVVDLARSLAAGQAPTVKDGVLFGLVAIALLYLRSSTAVLVVGLGGLCLGLAVAKLRGGRRWRAVGSLAVAGGVFLLLLAPWSVLSSHTLGGRVVTTTTMPTVEANTFGDRDELCFGPCDPDSTVWFRPLRYAREVARATGTSEVDVLKVMSDHALRDVEATGYLEQVSRNFDAYLTRPNSFTGYLAPADGRGTLGGYGEQVARATTWLLYVPLMLLGLASMLFVARSSVEARLLDLVLKISIGALLLQPFVHIAGGRYWTTAGPVLVLAGLALIRERRIAWAQRADHDVVADRALTRWIGRTQLALVVAAATPIAVLAVVSI